MGFLLRTLRAPALVAAAAALLVATWPALAAPPTGTEITIVKPDGKAYPGFQASEAGSDLNTTYNVRRADGTIERVDVSQGTSIYELLDHVEAPVYDTATVTFADGREVTLTSGQVNMRIAPGFFKDDTTGQTMFMGAPSSKANDYVDAANYFPVNGAGVRITLDKGAELTVDLEASRKQIEPGESVKFTATVSPSGSYTYKWTLEPGVRREAGRTVTHRFDEVGKYQVAVGAYFSPTDSSAGGNGGVLITVGDPEEGKEDQPGNDQEVDDTAPPTGPGTVYPSTPTPAPVPPTPPTPTPTDPVEPDLGLSGTTVEGNLLAAANDPPPTNLLESAARAAREAKSDDDGPDGAGVSEAALSVAGVLALLALGAGIETRQGRRPRLRLRLPRRTA